MRGGGRREPSSPLPPPPELATSCHRAGHSTPKPGLQSWIDPVDRQIGAGLIYQTKPLCSGRSLLEAGPSSPALCGQSEAKQVGQEGSIPPSLPPSLPPTPDIPGIQPATTAQLAIDRLQSMNVSNPPFNAFI